MATKKETTKLTPKELRFVDAYMEYGNATKAYEKAGYSGTRGSMGVMAHRLLNKTKISQEICRRKEEMHKKNIATGDEVMDFYSKAMRGEIKDQFGLEATLSDRLKAANELAKRTVDITNRSEGKADAVVQIKVDWSR